MTQTTRLIAAAYTPMAEDGSLDLGPIDALAELYTSCGVDGVFVCGSTGECHALSTDERLAIGRRWIDVAGAELDVIVHVGHNCPGDAIALAADAREAGAKAIAAMAPTYHRPVTIDELLDVFEPIAAAGGALPFYFYDIPALSGVSFASDRVLELGSKRLPTLAGIKFTSSDLMRFQSCVRLDGGRFDLLFGCDECLLAGLALGAAGAIGSTYNYAAPVTRRVIDAFHAGDLDAARCAEHDVVRLVEVLLEHGVNRTGKAIMQLIGAPCGPPRKPVRRVARHELETVYESLCDLDIFSRPLRAPA